MRFITGRALHLLLALICLVCLTVQAAPGRAAVEAAQDAAPAGERRTVSAEALFASTLVNAEKGQPQAMLTVGVLYEQGVGVPRNFTKAFEWYGKAANAGESAAWMRLGACYEIGVGTTADTDKALAAYTRAASMNYAPAQHKLAGMYLNGIGVPPDKDKGFDFLSKAAKNGESAAMYDMGQVLRAGLLGRKADLAEARGWFAKGAEAGHAGSVLALASMLKDGAGGRADPAGALRWYLIGQKGGLSGEPLDAVIKELRGKLTAAKANDAEKAADAWLAAKNKAMADKK